MTNTSHSTTQSSAPAAPIGATVRCIFYHPWQRPDIEKVGIVRKHLSYKNQWFMWVEATDGKAKWVSAADFIGLVPPPEAQRAETHDLEITLEADPDYQLYLHQLAESDLLEGQAAY